MRQSHEGHDSLEQMIIHLNQVTAFYNLILIRYIQNIVNHLQLNLV